MPHFLPEQRDLVDGKRAPVECTCVPLTDPNTGDILGRAGQSAPEAVAKALEAADRLHRHGDWADASLDARESLLEHLAQRLEARAEAIAYADAIDSGVPLSVTTMFAQALPDIVRGAVQLLRACQWERELASGPHPVRLLARPWGPAAVIAPFNAPAFTVVKKAAFGLAAGCPVIAKPSPLAPHSANLVADAVTEAIASANAPSAIFQLVHGDATVGGQLAASPHVKCIAFTGSRAAGHAIARAASDHFPALQVECGSNNPVIVRADADIATTAAALVSGFTKLNGQWCESPGSVFLPASLHDRLLDALLTQLSALTVGSSLDPACDFGPQANLTQQQSVEDAVAQLERGGGKRHLPDLPVVAGGHFTLPTIVTGADPRDTVEEIFGPVLTLHPVDTDEEALQLANERAGGLAGYVFGQDITTAMAVGGRVEAGEVKVNGTSVLDLHSDSAQSFWLGSGIGGHGNAELLRSFTGQRIVGVDQPGTPI